MSRSTQQRKGAFEAKAWTRPRAKIGSDKAAATIRQEQTPISLPSVAGQTYAYQGAKLIVNGQVRS